MSEEWAGAVPCFRKQQLISAPHPQHMGLCLALHLREAPVCGTSYFILIMAGYPWQLGSQWEPRFLKWVVGKKRGRGWVMRMWAPRLCPSTLPQPFPAGCVVSSEGCGTPGEWIITCQPRRLPVIHNPGLTQHRPVQAICWDHRALASRSGPVWPQLVRNHINMLHQALQMHRLRIAGRAASCLLQRGWSGSSITVLTGRSFFFLTSFQPLFQLSRNNFFTVPGRKVFPHLFADSVHSISQVYWPEWF